MKWALGEKIVISIHIDGRFVHKYVMLCCGSFKEYCHFHSQSSHLTQLDVFVQMLFRLDYVSKCKISLHKYIGVFECVCV